MYKSGRSFRNVLVHNHFIFAFCLIIQFSTRTTIPSLVQLNFPSLLIYVQKYNHVGILFSFTTMDGIISPQRPGMRRVPWVAQTVDPKLRLSALPRGVLLKRIVAIYFKMR